MARKKNRPTLALPTPEGAITTEPVTSSDLGTVTLPTEQPNKPSEPFFQTPLGKGLKGLFKAFASLQLAIVLLTCFGITLIAATYIESWYSTKVVGDTVYHTWWFALLLTLLLINIICAALKKMDLAALRQFRWPWKRHQTGFLVTHVGLVILVSSGLLTAFGGVEGQMVMVDTKNPELQDKAGLSNTTSTIHLGNEDQIEVFQVAVPSSHGRRRNPLGGGQDEAAERQFTEVIRAISRGEEVPENLRSLVKGTWRTTMTPGSFAWYDDPAKKFTVELPRGLKILNAIANPFPGFAATLAPGVEVKVNNYYPHTEFWPYSPAESDKLEQSFPALKVKITPPGSTEGLEKWVTGEPIPSPDSALVFFQMFTTNDPALVGEFSNPPDPLPSDAKEPSATMGREGQLVLVFPEKPHEPFRLPVDRTKLNQAIAVPGTRRKVTLLEIDDLVSYIGRMRGGAPHDPTQAGFPMVRFSVTEEDQPVEMLLCARLPQLKTLQFKSGEKQAEFSACYHYPDYQWGKKNNRVMGAMHFLQGPEGKVYYRVYGKDGLKEKGQPLDVTSTSPHELPWRPMGKPFEFRVMGYLPNAVERGDFMPRNVRPGAEPTERLQPAIRATLTIKGQPHEFWARMGMSPARVQAGDDMYLIRFRQARIHTPFAVTLERARADKDPGTTRAASYQSDILLDLKDGSAPTKHQIYMNHTLDHGGYRFFQANYQELTDPESGMPLLDGERPVAQSGLTLARDPGLEMKYLGSTVVVLGIFIMFWMKAYFFKSLGTRGAEEAAVQT